MYAVVVTPQMQAITSFHWPTETTATVPAQPITVELSIMVFFFLFEVNNFLGHISDP